MANTRLPSQRQWQERRADERFPLILPVVVKYHGSSNKIVGITRDVSAGGIYVYVPAWPGEGLSIRFSLTLPAALTSFENIHIAGVGRVVRVERLERERMGMAATIDSYEFLSPRYVRLPTVQAAETVK